MDPLLIQQLRRAVDLEPSLRPQFVASAFPDDPKRRDLLRDLLTAFHVSSAETEPEPESEFVDPSKPAAPASVWSPEAGARMGPFRLIRTIGAGGMGTVWLAERDDAFRQRVAVKCLHAYLSIESRERFQRERSLLARLEHPFIARILDGGECHGRLWYAMELVDGLPIDRFVRERGLNLDARLNLFRHLCEIVHVAHQNLIVHRDLKPANVLVDQQGQIRLLDFGIAKLLDGSEALTESRAPMTIAYAAPEQVRGEAVSTATDLYALGVMLFELLTGERPHEAAQSAYDVMQRITETDPEPPSIIAQRGNRGRPVSARSLAGDLDTIVLTALAREPSRRYPSAQALADDLRRFQEGLPIEARPDSAGYRWRKLLIRHRWPVGLLVATVISVLVALSLLLLSSRRETAALREAAVLAEANEQSRAFMVSLFEAAAPEQSLGQPLRAIDLLDRGWQRLQTEPLDAATLAQIALSIGDSYYGLGDMPKARDAYQLALDRLEVGQPVRRIDLGLRLASVEAELVQFEAARTRVQASLVMAADLNRPELQRRGLRVLGFIERDAARFDASIAALQQALALVPMADSERAALLNSLAFTEALAGNARGAAQAFDACRALLAPLPAAHPARVWLDYTEGDSWRKLGDYGRAKPLLKRAADTVAGMSGQGDAIARAIAQAQVALQLASGQALAKDLVTQAGLDQPMAARINLPELEVRLLSAEAALVQPGHVPAPDDLNTLRHYCIAHFGEAQPICRR
ncbi:hypothetical protein C7S18_14985 [Ahniella affigens]|uniref:Protein kinase domain-containing protein n=1 Tax=Ahniella affigens TaxID=2021234 RepID=A0A2P1PUB8_9GAMM|nr:serine/threonine-protein kinase [Ahniella affigens]AVP98412.1 hypothetical protein C7S18_14985 [Ahniella affigens]